MLVAFLRFAESSECVEVARRSCRLASTFAERADRALAGLEPETDRGLGHPAFVVVMRDESLGLIRRSLRKLRNEHLGDPAVVRLSGRLQQRLVRLFLNQRMAKGVHGRVSTTLKTTRRRRGLSSALVEALDSSSGAVAPMRCSSETRPSRRAVLRELHLRGAKLIQAAP